MAKITGLFANKFSMAPREKIAVSCIVNCALIGKYNKLAWLLTLVHHLHSDQGEEERG